MDHLIVNGRRMSSDVLDDTPLLTTDPKP